MKWLELKLDTSPAGLDPVSQLLEEQGITGLVIDDEGDISPMTRRVITGWRRCGWPCHS